MANVAGLIPVPCTGREEICAPAPSLNDKSTEEVTSPNAEGVNAMTTVQLVAETNVAVQVPPVPGNVPPE